MAPSPLSAPEQTSPSPFFAGTRLQFAWDQTSLGLLMECPRKYQLKILEGWRPKGTGLHLTFGKHYATAMETFSKLRAQGWSYDDALEAVVYTALTDSWDHDHDEEGNPMGGTPWDSGDPNKNRWTLIRSIVWYFETYREDEMKTVILPDGSPAVELLFQFDSGITCAHGEFLFTGHIDRLVDFDGTIFVMDQKTTKSGLGSYYFRQYDTDNQMSQYTYAGKVCYNSLVAGVVIDAAQILVGSTAFSRGITTRTAAQLDEWHANAEAWLGLAQIFEAKLRVDPGFAYPMNLKSCNNYGECDFRKVCSLTPELRASALATYFETSFWNPLNLR